MRRMLFGDNRTVAGTTCYLDIIIVLVTVLAWSPICSAHRGPHHPRGEVSLTRTKLDPHLAYENQHIAEDLKKMKLPDDKTIADMTEDERNFLYFKAHDLDGNGKLDGLEMYYSATHHSLSQHSHDHDDEDEDDDEADEENKGQTQFKLLDANGSGNSVDLNFNHVIEILDNFLDVADLNKDGYLHYPEYAGALKLANINAQPELQKESASVH